METLVRGIHGPFALVFMPVSVRGFALFTQRDIGQFRKGLIGFPYDHKKSANVIM